MVLGETDCEDGWRQKELAQDHVKWWQHWYNSVEHLE